ncbi:Ig-like domain-containing protein [Candidatus Latescibacterota bacterium]
MFVLISISCAKMGYPPGGSVDEDAPELVSSSPDFDETGVSSDASIVLEFSEPMNEENVEGNLFIIPIPVTWPEFRWSGRGRVLTLKPAEPLKENTTYVITIGSKASDIRNNGLNDSIILCFSTGEVLENKKIRGKAIPYDYFGKRNASEIDIVAFRLNDLTTDPDPRNDIPGYFTQTGIDGTYEIAGLSQGRYRIFAIGDKDKDGFYTENYDLIGVMPHDMELSESDSVLTAPEIMILERFTSEIELSTIRAADNRRLELFFNREIAAEPVQIEFENLDILGWFVDKNRPKVLSVATGIQKNRKYALNTLDVTDSDRNSLLKTESQPSFTGSDRPDTTSLEIVEWNPKILSSPEEHINLVFNRILDFPKDITGVIEQESGEKLSVKMISPNKLEMAPYDKWQNGFNYVILLDRDRFKSISGNSLSETSAELKFRVVPEDTLGTIEGTIEDVTGNPDSSYRIIVKHIETETVKEYFFESPGKWTTGTVLPGQYLFLAHKDSDNDRVISPGNFYRYIPSEQVVSYPDTVTVEPRWPVENIDFSFH